MEIPPALLQELTSFGCELMDSYEKIGSGGSSGLVSCKEGEGKRGGMGRGRGGVGGREKGVELWEVDWEIVS